MAVVAQYAEAADALNLIVVVAVALTFPLQFFAAAESLEHTLGMGAFTSPSSAASPGSSRSCWSGLAVCVSSELERKRTAFRCALVAATLALAVSIPHLGLVIALLGSLCGGAIELLLPPVLVLGSGICR